MNCELCHSLEINEDRIIYKNDHIFILVNIEPIKDGHVMILPIRHAEQLKDLTQEESKSFLEAIDACMQIVAEIYQDHPMCLVNGWNYRTQAHLHAHVLPSKNNLRGLYSASEGLNERKRASVEELKNIADRFKCYFENKS